MSRCETAVRSRAKKRLRKSQEQQDGSRCQSPSPGDCGNAAERTGRRKTSATVRATDGSTRPIKEGPQLAPGGDSEQSANGSRANRAMAGNSGKDEEARKGASRWSARKKQI